MTLCIAEHKGVASYKAAFRSLRIRRLQRQRLNQPVVRVAGVVTARLRLRLYNFPGRDLDRRRGREALWARVVELERFVAAEPLAEGREYDQRRGERAPEPDRSGVRRRTRGA